MRTRILLAMLALAALIAACSNDKSSSSATTASPTAGGAAAVTGTQAPASSQSTSGPEAVAAVVQQVRGGVVLVRAGSTASRGPFGSGSTEGSGSGFVVDPRGYIVTNNHVVTLGTDTPATQLQVVLTDGQTLDASLVGRDARTDLAVLKVNASNLTPLPWADPKGIEVGQTAVAIGFPLDLGESPTVTTGVVSATERVINETLAINGRPNRLDISGAIQTDAAINPGNSGGPLVNLKGEVMGINTAGLSSAGGEPVQGIFFAIGSEVAQPIVQTLIEQGNVQRGYLGVQAATVTPDVAQANNLAVNAGAAVVSEDQGAAAARAGVQTGDVIVKIGDQTIANTGDLARVLTRYQPGQSVPVEIVRDGQHQTIQVTLDQTPTG